LTAWGAQINRDAQNVETTSLRVTNNRREILRRAATDTRVSRFRPGQVFCGQQAMQKLMISHQKKMNFIFADADRPFMVVELNQPNVS
jgi:hypothetical protein